MNKDLSHLPRNKQDDLLRIVAIIQQHCPNVGMVILFGSYARGDWREEKDLAPDSKTGHPSDYDILAITQEEGERGSLAWKAVSDDCAEAGLSAMPRFIDHDIDFVNAKLERGQYFFADIVAEGRLLYDAGQFKLASRRELNPAERLRIVQDDFDEWFESAQQFFEGHKFFHSKTWMKKAAFNLHQAAEAAYKTVLLVFTGYIPKEHYLALLGVQAAKIDPQFPAIFQSEGEFEREAFNSLEYAYIGARYDKHYTIDEPTLIYLAERVEALLRLTRKRCREKIDFLQTAVAD